MSGAAGQGRQSDIMEKKLKNLVFLTRAERRMRARMSRYVLVFTASFSFFCGYTLAQEPVKEPNVSGQFYGGNAFLLSRQVESLLEAAPQFKEDKRIKVLVVPHAGYVFSGSVAAAGYKAIEGQEYGTIVLIGPSHYYAFSGIAVWEAGGFKTPLGVVEVDADVAQRLIGAQERIEYIPGAFDREHSLEVQLPFIQKTLPDAKIVPVLMGEVSYQDCVNLADALYESVGHRDDVLVVVSTDLSHYHDYTAAKAMDQKTLDVIGEGRFHYLWKACRRRDLEMCGFSAVVSGMLYAEKTGASGRDILQYANSGDVTGDKSRVVGYSSVIFYQTEEQAGRRQDTHKDEHANGGEAQVKARKEEGALTLDQKSTLMAIAKSTITSYVRSGEVPEFSETDPRLHKHEGAFVTVKKEGRLRGCIGRIIGDAPLYRIVRDMAVAAVSKDPRFPPVKTDELDELEVEISVLSRPRPIRDIGDIVLGKHGVIVSQGLFHRGVFLPQVAEEFNWNREEFLSNLCAHKAGLPADAWKDPKTKIEIFSAEVFSESDLSGN